MINTAEIKVRLFLVFGKVGLTEIMKSREKQKPENTLKYKYNSNKYAFKINMKYSSQPHTVKCKPCNNGKVEKMKGFFCSAVQFSYP